MYSLASRGTRSGLTQQVICGIGEREPPSKPRTGSAHDNQGRWLSTSFHTMRLESSVALTLWWQLLGYQSPHHPCTYVLTYICTMSKTSFCFWSCPAALSVLHLSLINTPIQKNKNKKPIFFFLKYICCFFGKVCCRYVCFHLNERQCYIILSRKIMSPGYNFRSPGKAYCANLNLASCQFMEDPNSLFPF